MNIQTAQKLNTSKPHALSQFAKDNPYFRTPHRTRTPKFKASEESQQVIKDYAYKYGRNDKLSLVLDLLYTLERKRKCSEREIMEYIFEQKIKELWEELVTGVSAPELTPSSKVEPGTSALDASERPASSSQSLEAHG